MLLMNCEFVAEAVIKVVGELPVVDSEKEKDPAPLAVAVNWYIVFTAKLLANVPEELERYDVVPLTTVNI